MVDLGSTSAPECENNCCRGWARSLDVFKNLAVRVASRRSEFSIDRRSSLVVTRAQLFITSSVRLRSAEPAR